MKLFFLPFLKVFFGGDGGDGGDSVGLVVPLCS